MNPILGQRVVRILWDIRAGVGGPVGVEDGRGRSRRICSRRPVEPEERFEQEWSPVNEYEKETVYVRRRWDHSLVYRETSLRKGLTEWRWVLKGGDTG